MKLSHIKQPDLFGIQTKPQSIVGVYDRMILRVIEPSNKSAFKQDCTCHKLSINYIIKHGKPSDRLVMVGFGNTVTHSFVVNIRGEILADTNISNDPVYDGKMYTVGKDKFKHMWNKTARDIARDIKEILNK